MGFCPHFGESWLPEPGSAVGPFLHALACVLSCTCLQEWRATAGYLMCWLLYRGLTCGAVAEDEARHRRGQPPLVPPTVQIMPLRCSAVTDVQRPEVILVELQIEGAVEAGERVRRRGRVRCCRRCGERPCRRRAADGRAGGLAGEGALRVSNSRAEEEAQPLVPCCPSTWSSRRRGGAVAAVAAAAGAGPRGWPQGRASRAKCAKPSAATSTRTLLQPKECISRLELRLRGADQGGASAPEGARRCLACARPTAQLT